MTMKDYVKRVPIPACGVMLGTASLGTMLQNWLDWPYYICGIAATFLLVLVIARIIMYPKIFAQDMQNPVLASVFCTLDMSLMVLSTYAANMGWYDFGYVMWWVAICMHFVLMVYFTLRFMIHLDMTRVFASYYITYVGIVVASVTSPTYGRTDVGAFLFWFGFCAFIPLIVLITRRYLKYRDIPQGSRSLICIYGAPASLCIAGYTQSVSTPSYGFLLCMYVLACAFYVLALIMMLRNIWLPFYPSCASFTFPFVISATATMQVMAITTMLGSPIPLSIVGAIQAILASILVTYTYGRYMKAVFGKTAAPKSRRALR